MKIKSIHIDGFGHFHDASLENLPGGLVIISGDNEAGKSTLLGFIRAILFGFPQTRGNENLYLPLAGGRHGGRITVWTETRDEVVIERMEGKRGGRVDLLFKNTGAAGGEEELKRLLRGFNRTIYKNIYAFSLEELQTFDSLSAQDVRGALYGAGAGTSLTAIPTTMKKLEKKLEELFKSRGSKPIINEKLSCLEENRKEIRTAAGEIKTYEDLLGRIQDTETQIKELKKDKKSDETKQSKIETYLKLWDQWIILQAAEAGLEKLPVIVTKFPDDGLIRLKNLNENLENSRKSLEKEENKLAGLNTTMENLVIDELLIANELEICALKDNLKIYTANIEGWSIDQRSLDQKIKDIHRELANLGSDWTEQRVYSIDRSLFAQDEIAKHQESQNNAGTGLNTAETALSHARQDCEIGRDKQDKINEELREFQDLKPPMDKKLISAIQDGKQQFASLSKELPNRRKELEKESDALDNTIKEIDPNWNIANVEAFDCSLPAQEKIQEFEERFSKAKENISERKKELEFQESSLAEVEKERHAGKENIPPTFIDHRLKWLAISFFSLGIIIIGIGGLLVERPAVAFAGGIFIIAALFMILKFREGRKFQTILENRLKEDQEKTMKKKKRYEEAIEDIKARLKSSQEAFEKLQARWEEYLENLSLNPGIKPGTASLIFSKIEGIKTSIRNINTLAGRISELETDGRDYSKLFDRIPQLAGKISVDSHLSRSLIEEFLEQNEKKEERRRKRNLITQKLEDQEKDNQVLEKKLKEAEQRYWEAVNQRDRARQAWRAWLSKSGLDPGISPGTASKAMITINNCIQLIDARAEIEKSIQQKEKQVETYRASAEALFAKISGKKPGPGALGANIQLLYDEMNKSKLDLEKRKNLEEQCIDARLDIEDFKKETQRYQTEIQKLLWQGGAEDEETFRFRGELFKKRQKFLEEKENAAKNMKIISGLSGIDELQEILSRYSKEKLEEENRDLKQKIEEIDDALEKADDELRETNNQLKNLSSSDKISRLRAREEKLKEDIRGNARIWGVNAIARHLVIKAREKFEKERQPEVIKEASRFFDTFTGGKYKEIIAPLGEQSIEVMTSRGKRKKPGQLSRATAEQLFLALRFGYMANYAERSEGFPVVMDDILVNFDPTRLNHTARTIFQLAETHQVLFFTCHPGMVSIFKEQKADAPVFYIKGGTFVQSGDI